MATESAVQHIGSLTAAADLSAAQFKGVKITAARVVNVVSASADKPIGVLQNKPTLGQPCDIAISGEVMVAAGAAVAAGAEVMFDATARVITAVATTGNRIVGVAIDAAGAAGDIISVMFGAVGSSRLSP